MYSEELGTLTQVATLRENEAYKEIYIWWMYLITHFVVPFLILILFNSKIAYALHRANRRRQDLSKQDVKQHKTTTMMIVVILIFLLCNTLAFTLNIVENTQPELTEMDYCIRSNNSPTTD